MKYMQEKEIKTKVMTHDGLVEHKEVKPCNYSQELISTKKRNFLFTFQCRKLEPFSGAELYKSACLMTEIVYIGEKTLKYSL